MDDTTDTYVLDDAAQRVYDRADAHGEPEDTFPTIATHWNVWTDDDDLTAFDTAIMLAQMKLARVQEGESVHESLVDVAGYIENAARLYEHRGETTGADTSGDDVTMLGTDQYDDVMAMFRDNPEIRITADEATNAVAYDTSEGVFRGGISDMAVNMDCIESTYNGYVYHPEDDPSVGNDDTDTDSVETPQAVSAAEVIREYGDVRTGDVQQQLDVSYDDAQQACTDAVKHADDIMQVDTNIWTCVNTTDDTAFDVTD